MAATIWTTGDLAAAGACGLRAGRLETAGLSGWPLESWGLDRDHADARGMGMPALADVPPLPVYGRGWRRRLALVSGLAQAAVAVRGDGEPATNGRLLQRLRGR